jgi:hypothetical protein
MGGTRSTQAKKIELIREVDVDQIRIKLENILINVVIVDWIHLASTSVNGERDRTH